MQTNLKHNIFTLSPSHSFSLSLSVSLSVPVSVPVSVSLSLSVSVSVSVSLSVCLSLCLSLCVSLCVSLCLFLSLSLSLFFRCNNFFYSVYVNSLTCFGECFYSMWTERHFFHKSLSLPWSFFNRHILAFFGASASKEVLILYALSPQ